MGRRAGKHIRRVCHGDRMIRRERESEGKKCGVAPGVQDEASNVGGVKVYEGVRWMCACCGGK